jgi:hypothetical protein
MGMVMAMVAMGLQQGVWQSPQKSVVPLEAALVSSLVMAWVWVLMMLMMTMQLASMAWQMPVRVMMSQATFSRRLLEEE